MNYDETKKFIEKLDLKDKNKAFLDLVNYFKENNIRINEKEYEKLIDEYPFITHVLDTIINNEEFQELIEDNEYIICLMEIYNLKNENNVNDDLELVSDSNYNFEETVDNWDYVKIFMTEAGKYEILSHEETIELFRNFKAGDKNARKKIINHNLKLVISVAKRFSNQGLEFADLIQEGNIGLMKAVEKFDPEKGFRFSTYATWWIRQSIGRSIYDNGKTVRIPVHVNEAIKKVKSVKNKLTQSLGHEPNIEEIAKEIGYTTEKVREIVRASQLPVYMDEAIGEDHDTTIGDMMVDENTENAIELMENKDLRNLLLYALDTLEERQKEVLMMRFGLNGDRPMTLDEIGKHYDVTRERVRQIEHKALSRLRRNTRVKNTIYNYSNDSDDDFIQKYGHLSTLVSKRLMDEKQNIIMNNSENVNSNNSQKEYIPNKTYFKKRS